MPHYNARLMYVQKNVGCFAAGDVLHQEHFAQLYMCADQERQTVNIVPR